MTATAHTGHLLLTSGLVAVTLAGVALAEQWRAHSRPRTAPDVLVVAATGAAAGMVHLALAPSHWASAPVYGAFFVVAGLTQVGWSTMLLFRPSRPLLALQATANAAVLLLWLQTRTLGVPLGPTAGVREGIGPVDLGCALLELVGVLVALRLLARPPAQPRAAQPKTPRDMVEASASALALKT